MPDVFDTVDQPKADVFDQVGDVFDQVAAPPIKRTREEVAASIPPSDMPGPIGQAAWNALGALYTPFQMLSHLEPTQAISDAIGATMEGINKLTGFKGKTFNPMEAPAITPEQASQIVGAFSLNAGPPTDIGQAVQDTAAGLLSGLSTPKSVLAMAGGKVSPAVPATSFGVPMVQDIPEATKAVGESEAGAEKNKAILRLLLDVAAPIQLARDALPRKVMAETIADTFTAPEVSPDVKGELGSMAGRDMPVTTKLSQAAGEAGVRAAAAGNAAPHLANYFSAKVLDGLPNVDPNLLGAAITEDGLRGLRDQLLDQAHKAANAGDMPAAEALLKEAAEKKTMVGEGAPFKSEADFQKFVERPDVREAVDRAMAERAQHIDPLAEQMGIDITKPPPSGGVFGKPIFFNLFPIKEGAIPDWFRPTGQNSVKVLGSTPGMKRGVKFAKQRTGTAEGYAINFHDMVQNAVRGFLPAATWTKFEAKLRDAGLAVRLPAGASEPFPGWVKAKGGLGVGDLWLNPRIEREFGAAANAYKHGWEKLGAVKLQAITNRIQMWGIIDAFTHITGQAKNLFESPDAHLKTDTALSLLMRSDVALKAYRAWKTATAGSLESLRKKAELASIGALDYRSPNKGWDWVKNPLGPAVHHTIEGIRLMQGDVYDELARQGVVKWSETGKRDFVNQGLQYNKRLQGPVIRFLRDTQIGPFATAARARLIRGVKAGTLSPWLQGADLSSKAWLRANMLAKMGGTAGLIYAINYAINGTGVPRGTKLGQVALNEKDKRGNPLKINLLDKLSSLGTFLRETGIGAAVEAKRSGLSNTQAGEAALRDIINTDVLGFAGPAPRFATTALTGSHLYLQNLRKGLARIDSAKPGESQALLNLQTGSQELNPLVAAGLQTSLGGEPQKDFGEQLRGLLGVVPGTKPELQSRLPRIVTSGEFNDYLDTFAHKIRNAPLGERSKVIREGLQGLTGQQRQKAIAELQRRHLLPRPVH